MFLFRCLTVVSNSQVQCVTHLFRYSKAQRTTSFPQLISSHRSHVNPACRPRRWHARPQNRAAEVNSATQTQADRSMFLSYQLFGENCHPLHLWAVRGRPHPSIWLPPASSLFQLRQLAFNYPAIITAVVELFLFFLNCSLTLRLGV